MMGQTGTPAKDLRETETVSDPKLLGAQRQPFLLPECHLQRGIKDRSFLGLWDKKRAWEPTFHGESGVDRRTLQPAICRRRQRTKESCPVGRPWITVN